MGLCFPIIISMSAILHNLVTYMYTAPDDYSGIQNRLLTFSAASTSVTVPVPIIDDLLDEEDTEKFNASLVQVTNSPRVLIDPQLAEVIILDNDGMFKHIVVNNFITLLSYAQLL